MSSFLDSTGLSRLVSKITDYFAKKDGTYPDMTVGMLNNMYSASVTDFNDFNSTLNTCKYQATNWNQPHAPESNEYYNVYTNLGGSRSYTTQLALMCGRQTNKLGLFLRTKTSDNWTDWFSADLYGYTGVGGCVVIGTGGYYPIMRFTSESGTLAWHATAQLIPHGDSNLVPQRVEIDLAIRSSNYVGYATQKNISDYTNFNLRTYNNSGVVTVYLYCTNQMYGAVSIKCDQISNINHYHRLTGVEAYRDSRNQQSVPSGTLLTGYSKSCLCHA